MKPGGPTERKIGETLANQGNSTVNPLATKVSNPKPKPTKIDPLTGLPKVKVPKLKKPTNAMWEQAANQQKPETSSWFKSTKLQPVSNEAHAENARTMDGMLNYSNNGFLPTLYADAVKNGGDQAIAEYANFLNQLSARKKERVDGFEQEVMNKLPDNQKQVLLALAEGGQETGGDTVVYQISDGQAKSQATNQEKTEEKGKSSVKRPEDTCLNQKVDFWAAEAEYQYARDAMDTVQEAIDEVKTEIKNMESYSVEYPHPECKNGKMELNLPLELESETEIEEREGISFSVNVLKGRLKWVQVMLCSMDRNGEEVFSKEQAISDLENHLEELESVESDLSEELRLLKQASDNTLEIYSRCTKKEGED